MSELRTADGKQAEEIKVLKEEKTKLEQKVSSLSSKLQPHRKMEHAYYLHKHCR